MANNQPIKKWKSGSIEAAIWVNEKEFKGEVVSFKTVSLRKSWKDDKGVWRDSAINLRRNDLAKTILVLQKAQEDMLLNTEEGEKDE